MVNASKIKARANELSISYEDIALALSLPLPITMKKLNGLSALNLAQAETLAFILKISDEDFGEYFFA